MSSTDQPIPQSGVVPYRIEGDEIGILLITARRTGRWIVPKGTVEPYLSPVQSAAKEAYEEAGIRGVVGEQPIGEYRYEKFGESYAVELFLMEVTEELPDWQESHLRERQWVDLAEAEKRVEIALLKEIFADFRSHLA